MRTKTFNNLDVKFEDKTFKNLDVKFEDKTFENPAGLWRPVVGGQFRYNNCVEH